MRALMDGRVAIRPIDRFDATGFPSRVAAPVPGWEDAEDRRTPLVLATLGDLRIPAGRTGVFLGAESGRGRFDTLRELVAAGGTPFDEARFSVEGRRLADRMSPDVVSPAAPAVAVARAVGAKGPVETVSLACASGLAAIVEATRAIALGECDVAIAGGVGVDVDPVMLAGFGKLQALSAKGVSRPFDRRRDGFVVGEGAALVVLTAEPGPVRVAGVGRSMDAVHLTMPDPAGGGAERAMRHALLGTGIDALDLVAAHGTSTPLNDAVEAAAIARLGLPIRAVNAVKGALGHWVAGAGALAFGTAFHALTTGEQIPTAGLEDPDDALPHVRAGRRVETRTALVNAFAFGGANASVVLCA
jgi:3-oxoacyl-[acyl-carrier-protein] synthase II